MIKFFRRIRSNLIAQENAKKYFFYAVGEIVLVVIGILIALQINNWNEQGKNDALEENYYCSLLEDLVQDTIQTNALILQAENRLKAANQAIRLLQKTETNKLDVGKQIWLATKAIYIDFRPNDATFEDLKSANLNLIKDKSILKSLNTYYNNVESLKSIIMVNGKNALDRYYAHVDGFASGDAQASLLYGRFKEGMEKDVYESFVIDENERLSSQMKDRLYNESLVYISTNTRQLELYRILKEYAASMILLINNKCL